MPGSITKISICGVGLVLLLLTTGNASAYLCHSVGCTWGTNFVSLGGNTIADAAEICMSENDKMQQEMETARLKLEEAKAKATLDLQIMRAKANEAEKLCVCTTRFRARRKI